ncbi:hypothetical protein DXG03_006406 [Asterophora parasitica]|uniref:Uncharacterized protein n=1 Tax=Asterophora parasitica TaxID=117018 RepID=A0A9P7KDI6_9AGAR|nr:hypothetical protein DXG03_006406 [Asterophora parasitica]
MITTAFAGVSTGVQGRKTSHRKRMVIAAMDIVMEALHICPQRVTTTKAPSLEVCASDPADFRANLNATIIGFDADGQEDDILSTQYGLGDAHGSGSQHDYATYGSSIPAYGSGNQEDWDQPNLSSNPEFDPENTGDDSQTEFEDTNESLPSSHNCSISSTDSDKEEQEEDEDEAEDVDQAVEEDSYYPVTTGYAPRYYRNPQGDEDRAAYGYAPRYYIY